MVAEAFFAVPGDLGSLTGGYAYDREVIGRAAGHGVKIAHLALPGGFPEPAEDDLVATAEALGRLPESAVLLVDGLAFGAFTPALLDTIPRRTVALVHHPLALETGLSAARAAHLLESEQRALSHAAHVIVTSATTRDTLVESYHVPRTRISVAVPGTSRARRARGSGAAMHLLAVGSVTRRKGHDLLIEALAGLAGYEWRLTIAGSLARAPEHATGVARLVEAHGLVGRIRLAGEVSVDELENLYAAAEVFVMPSLYEGYGMALAEAMARGLPIVTTTGGAAARTVPDGAALKVAPGDVPALREALRSMLEDNGLRGQIARASWTAGQALPTWDDTARIVAEVLAGVARGERS